MESTCTLIFYRRSFLESGLYMDFNMSIKYIFNMSEKRSYTRFLSKKLLSDLEDTLLIPVINWLYWGRGRRKGEAAKLFSCLGRSYSWVRLGWLRQVCESYLDSVYIFEENFERIWLDVGWEESRVTNNFFLRNWWNETYIYWDKKVIEKLDCKISSSK